MLTSRLALTAAVLLASACGGSLFETPTLSAGYSTGSSAVLAGGTGRDDVWLFTGRSPVAWVHFDGATWSDVPLAELKAAQGTEFPSCAAATARKGVLLCADRGKVLEVTSAGAVTEVSSGVPVPQARQIVYHALSRGRAGSPVYLATSITESAGTATMATLQRRDQDTWVTLPMPPGPLTRLVPLEGERLWASGFFPAAGSNQPTDGFFATLENGQWSTTRIPEAQLGVVPSEVVRSPSDIWGVLKRGGVLATGVQAYGPVAWELVHFDGTTWTTVEVPVSERLVASGVAWSGVGLTQTARGTLALLNQNGEKLVMTEWDGLSTSVGAAQDLGSFTPAAIAGAGGLEFLGVLDDDSHAFLNPSGRTLLLGPVP